MSDLVEFLLARIAEDEARPDCDGSGEYASCERWSEQRERECAAKRRIVAVCAQYEGRHEDTYDAGFTGGAAFVGTSTIRALAGVYAEHPDYDEAWRS